MKTTVQKGYAKINLHLDVTGIMSNGFHSVNNVMQSISLYDQVTLTLRRDGKYSVKCNIPAVPMGKDNLAIKAALAFDAATGRSCGADIDIVKNIPMAAGLAGGSADAAAVLRGMNVLCGDLLSTQELCEIGATLGSDVPFCIVGGAAFADGKGDILHPFPCMPDCTIVVACGGEGVSTPMAYGMLDSIYDRFSNYVPKDISALEKAVKDGNIYDVMSNLYNIFEEPILSVRPVAKEIKDAMISSNAIGAMMSGSGPSVFGVFESQRDAEVACKKISSMNVIPYVCHPTI